MRHLKIFLPIFACATSLLAQIDPPGRVGRLNFIEGQVSFQPAGVNDWIEASVNRPLITGDYVWVADRGRAELHIGSTALRVGSASAVEFLDLDDRNVQLRLSEGTLTVRLRTLARDQTFEIDTPNLAFTLLRPGEYRIDANPDSRTTIVTVRDGEGDVTGGDEAFPVYARQRVVVRGDNQISYNLESFGGPDPWDQWCSSRDRREDQSRSTRYVSRDVIGYDDLDQYGAWESWSGYGDVWIPASVASGWAPYRDGQWVWISPWGWTWVDDAPWGFAPYHYGRWANYRGRWGWVPGPYGVTPIYAPALVAWVGGGGASFSFSIGTSRAVGWFPLGPREPYIPSYQVSQGYFTRVNNTNTVINTITINNYYNYSRNTNNTPITNITYANRTVQNGVTAVPQDTFGRGRRVTQDARPVQPAQIASVAVVAAPAVAPQRESVLGPRADTASRASRPPANVLSRPVVARRTPPPAPVAFDQQRPALTQNPGRPVPQSAVQGNRQNQRNESVRVMDMARVRRVEPGRGNGKQAVEPQAAPQPNGVQSPAELDRRKGPPGRQQPQTRVPQQVTPQNAAPQSVEPDRRKGPPERRQPQTQFPEQAAPPQVDRPQPQVNDRRGNDRRGNDRRNGPPGRQQPQPQAAPQSVAPLQNQVPQVPAQAPPQAPFEDRRKGPPARQQPPPQAAPPQQVAPPQAAPQPPAEDRRKGPPERQQPPPPPQSVAPPAPAPQPQAAPPPQQQAPPPQQSNGKGKQQDKEERDGKGKNR